MLDDHLPPDSFVLADKAYDAEWIRAMIEAQNAVPIIPDRSTAKTPHAFRRDLYRLRNRVECSSTNSNSSDASQHATKSSPPTTSR